MLCLPPSNFRAAVGVRSAKFLPGKPQFIHRGRSRGRFAVGLRYEGEVKDHLSLFALGRPNLDYRDGPWIEYQDVSGKRWCQPDALLVDSAGRVATIIEVKYQHTSDAWFQLKELYLPVLRVALAAFRFRLLEVVHWYDPLVAFPERAQLVPNLESLPDNDSVSVLIFNRRREHRFLSAGSRDRQGDGAKAGGRG